MPVRKKIKILAVITGAIIVFFLLIGFFFYFTSLKKIFLTVDGKKEEIYTRLKTVREVIESKDIELGLRDIIQPYPNTPLKGDMSIKITRVKENIEKCRVSIPFNTKVKTTSYLHKSEIIDFVTGENGEVEKIMKCLYYDDKKVMEKVLETKILKKPVEAEILKGLSKNKRPYMLSKRMKVVKTMTMRATAYYPGPEDCAPYDDGYTYLGYKAGYGVCAVDPKVIPFKTKLFIDGYGYAIACDIGSAIKKNKIDLCYDTLTESNRYGVKKVKVYMLK